MPSSNYQIKFLKIAEEDFAELISFIASDNPSVAEDMANKIEKDLLLLADPMLGRMPRDEDIKSLGYRYIIVQNYIIFYFIQLKKRK